MYKNYIRNENYLEIWRRRFFKEKDGLKGFIIFVIVIYFIFIEIYFFLSYFKVMINKVYINDLK